MTALRESVRMLHNTMEMYSHAKRFNERWLADPDFRAILFRDPERAIADYALPVDIDEVRGVTAGDAERAGSIARGITAISAMKSLLMQQWYGPDATPSNARFAAWRARQQERMRLELGPFAAKASIRAAWHAELTRGCTGGCWFCSMAAPALNAVAPADEPALDEWRVIVRELTRRLGPAIRTGFLDGATDPFDHPEYESFCRIVMEEAGFFPPTSTALALRDPERSRRFFAEARAAGCWSVRLTVRDEDELNAIHAAFSSAELAHVQLNAFTPRSSFVFSLAGRFRDHYLADPAVAARERRKLAFAPWYTMSHDYLADDDYPLDANTGVVGFRINLVDRSVALVTPRPSSDAFPLGIQTLDLHPFADIDGFGQALDVMIERWMPVCLRDSDSVSLWPGLRLEPIPGGARLHGRFRQFTDIIDEPHAARLYDVASRLERGTTLNDIVQNLAVDSGWARTTLHRFLDAGVLQEISTS